MAQPANRSRRGSAPSPGGSTLAPGSARPPGAPAAAGLHHLRTRGPSRGQPRRRAAGGVPLRPPSPSAPAASLGDQRPRTPRLQPGHRRHLPAPAPAGALRPSPYLSRRCAPGGGGPCWSKTTGRSGSGHGGSGPRAAGVGPAAGRTPRTQRLWPPPARPAPPGAPRGSVPPRPSAPRWPARSAGWGWRRGRCCRPRRAPQAVRGAGRLDAGRRAAGREEEEERKVCTGRSRLQPARSRRRKPQGSEPAALGACEPAQPLLPQGPGSALCGAAARGPSGCHPASRSVGCGRQELDCKVRVNYTLSINGTEGGGMSYTHWSPRAVERK